MGSNEEFHKFRFVPPGIPPTGSYSQLTQQARHPQPAQVNIQQNILIVNNIYGKNSKLKSSKKSSLGGLDIEAEMILPPPPVARSVAPSHHSSASRRPPSAFRPGLPAPPPPGSVVGSHVSAARAPSHAGSHHSSVHSAARFATELRPKDSISQISVATSARAASHAGSRHSAHGSAAGRPGFFEPFLGSTVPKSHVSASRSIAARSHVSAAPSAASQYRQQPHPPY